MESILCAMLGASLIPSGSCTSSSADSSSSPHNIPSPNGFPGTSGFPSPAGSPSHPTIPSFPTSSSSPNNPSISVEVPFTYDSIDVVDRNFLAFGFELSAFVNYILDSDGNTNEFTVNMIDSISSRTGGKPILRLGGTTADYGKYVANQTDAAMPSALVADDIGNTTIGPSFWELPSRIPEAAFVIQVPLATTDIDETILWTKSAVSIMNTDQIYSIEVGNEPDWYAAEYRGSNRKLGAPDWQSEFTNATYVGNYTERVDAIMANVDLPERQIFQAFDVSSHDNLASPAICYELKVEDCFDLGIDDGGYIKTVAHHYYQNQGGLAVELAKDDNLMNMTFTHWRLDFFHCSVDYLKANHPDVEFVLSELGNSLASDNEPEYQDRLGSALWQVDVYLYLMAMGVDRIHFQQMFAPTYQQNMWLPVEYLGVAPHVAANFYSQPFVGDFIGSSGKTTMKQLDISPAQESVSAYAAFESGVPRRVAVVNMDYWDQSISNGTRPGLSIDLSVPTGVTTVTVEQLNSPTGAGADDTTITYAGSQWTYESLGKEVKGVRHDSQTLDVVNGLVTITVDSSSAVLVFFS